MDNNELQWDIETLSLKLKYNWKISRNSSVNKKNLIIKVNNRPVGEAAPNIRFNQTIDIIKSEFESIKTKLPNNLNLLSSFVYELQNWNLSNCLKCALEMSCLNLLSEKKSYSCVTSYSIPILEINEYKDFFHQLSLDRFKVIKVKLNTKQVHERLDCIRKFYKGVIFVDFNEAFDNVRDFKKIIPSLNDFKVQLIEQPLVDKMYQDCGEFREELLGEIFLDESILDNDLPKDLNKYVDGVNIKLQKSGGILRSKEQISMAKQMKLKTMIGCMVESSLGISYAMQLAGKVDYFDLDGSLMIENEPFGMVKERDGRIYS